MAIGEGEKKNIYSIPRTNKVISRQSGERHVKDIKLNAACAVCSAREVLPYKCSYCGGTFCGDHRLPEKHVCRPVRELVVTEEMLKELEAKLAEPIDVPQPPPNPLEVSTQGVNPAIDEAIREELIELQRLYPGCADHLSLAMVKAGEPVGVSPDWLACAVREGERILLRDDKWTQPFCMLSAEARDVITHEFGHFVYWKLDYVEINEWNSIWEEYKVDDSRTSITQSNRYAFKNGREGFAEAFAAVEGFKYTSVNRTDPLFYGCRKLLKNHRSKGFEGR